MDAAGKKPVRAGRWILLGIAAFIVLLLIVCAAVVLLPVRRVAPADLLPSGSFAFCSYKINRADPAVKALIGAAKERLAGQGSGFIRRTVVGLLVPAALPDSVVVSIAAGSGAADPSILIFADVGSLSRLIGIFSRRVDGVFLKGPVVVEHVDGRRIAYASGAQGLNVSAYAVVGGTLILGSSLDAVKECVKGGAAPSSRMDISSRLESARESRDIELYFDNASGGMSRLVSTASDKYAFAAFPSVDSVTTVTGQIVLLPEKVDGTVTFTASSRVEEVQSDVKFLYGAIKRVVRASGAVMSGDVSVQGTSVLFTFEIPDYLKLIAPGEKK